MRRRELIGYLWADGQYRVPALVAELDQREVAVLVTTGGEPAALAAKAVTSPIPIVFTAGGDPVNIGLVESFKALGLEVPAMLLARADEVIQ